MEFQGKTVWITGAGRGIGKEIAQSFVNKGAHVVGLDKCFAEEGYLFQAVELDITNYEKVRSTINDLLIEDDSLDILVHAAGVLQYGLVEETTIEDWQQCFGVNAAGAFYLFKELAPYFKKKRAGSIISLASNSASVPRTKMAVYGASKAALVSLTKSVGLELAPYNIRCNIVSPGSTNTPMLQSMVDGDQGMEKIIQGLPEDFKLGIPLGKIGTTKEVADTVLFFSSDKASHITMQNIVVDGGATLMS